MSSKSFNWKSLFINEETSTPENEIVPPAQPTITPNTTINKFPEDKVIQTTTNNVVGNAFIPEILGVYEKGFESLNQTGFDFFEMYKSVSAVGITNPQSYQMAFAMGKSLRPDLSKELLIEKSKFYIEEINKVYTNYDATGNIKKQELQNQIIKEKEALTVTISDLETKILQMQQTLLEKRTLLANLDTNNENELRELQLKIEANNFAKQKILESINVVISGINQYL